MENFISMEVYGQWRKAFMNFELLELESSRIFFREWKKSRSNDEILMENILVLSKPLSVMGKHWSLTELRNRTGKKVKVWVYERALHEQTFSIGANKNASGSCSDWFHHPLSSTTPAIARLSRNFSPQVHQHPRLVNLCASSGSKPKERLITSPPVIRGQQASKQWNRTLRTCSIKREQRTFAEWLIT